MTEVQKKTLGIAILSLIMGCFFIIPLLGMIFGLVAIILGVIALSKISGNKDTLKGRGFAIAGIVLGSLGMVIMPLIGLLAAIAIPNFLKAKIHAQDAAAIARVRTLSSAIESYKAATGNYPESEEELFSSRFDFILPESFREKTSSGYVYTTELDGYNYAISAVPEGCGMTGTKNITFQSGELIERDCKPAER